MISEPDSSDALKDFRQKTAEICRLSSISAILEWDAQVNMPRSASPERGSLSGMLKEMQHQRFTSPEFAKTLEQAEKVTARMDPDSHEALHVRMARREFNKLMKVPSSWVETFTRTTIEAESIWESAREESDFSLFQPYLETLVSMCREYSDFFKPYDHIYDPLLARYESDITVHTITELFKNLKESQLSLLQAIQSQPQTDESFLTLYYAPSRQEKFVREVISQIGFDWNRGRLDYSAHPFTIAFGLDDVRITTKVIPQWPSSCIFGAIHECGHGLYELGLGRDLKQTLLSQFLSMSMHESQSLLYENIIGRSRSFWKYFYPKLQETFPENLTNVTLEQFYKAINCVKPSLIRIEADEATYNLHIMMRTELELKLMEGSLEVKHLPEAWHALSDQYLGITPPNDQEGVLQDVHWSTGLFGYFPAYTLGNLLSAMWWEKIQSDIPSLDQQIETGSFEELRDWLQTRIHQPGGKYTMQEMVQRICGENLNPDAYTRYLNKKYREIYRF